MRLLLALLCACVFAQSAEPQFVVLVTGDGIRHQEVFTGADAELMLEANKKSSGIETISSLRDAYWAEDPKERREKVMPFFWKELVPKHGVVFGNMALDSKAVVRNGHNFSYPGYAEILNGQPVAEVTSNDRNWSPRPTILEFLRDHLRVEASKIAAFGSWDVFNWITMTRDGAVFCNAGYERMQGRAGDEHANFWSELQFKMRSPWDTVRHDTPTLSLALEYLRAEKPRFLYLALGETDDWAHNRRYDRTLQTLHLFDDALRELWQTLQSTEPYAGRTTLIVTTDHGRGRTKEDWTDHGAKVPGAEEVWIGVFGPAVKARGEAKNAPTVSLSNIAATICQIYGADPKSYNTNAAQALPLN